MTTTGYPWAYPNPFVVDMGEVWAGVRPDDETVLLARLNLRWQRGIICDRPVLQGGARWLR